MSELAFVIPVFNQQRYTAQCLESLQQSAVPASSIIVVDNGSTDGTREFLAAQPGLQVIANSENAGCSAAWNQGVEAARAEWTVVLNNDVIVPAGFTQGLLDFARKEKCDIVSPAMGEGELDYDMAVFAGDFVSRMGQERRHGFAHGVCFMVHRRVFESIGLFDTRLGRAGYEDEDFFRRARAGGFRLATTGQAYLHHFGSVTQKSVKASLQMANSDRLGNRDYFRRKHGLHWMRRRTDRLRGKVRWSVWRWRERRRTGLGLLMRRAGGQWRLA